jgi:ribosome-associated heat shock protein Hsp15
MEAIGESVRLDVWLWAARFFKTRSLAKSVIEAGRVDVNGGTAKPSRAVRVNDTLRITRGEDHYEIVVLGLSDVRGSAPVAQALYQETEESRRARAAAAEQRRLAATGYEKPATKPDKRARRLIRALGDIDSL